MRAGRSRWVLASGPWLLVLLVVSTLLAVSVWLKALRDPNVTRNAGTVTIAVYPWVGYEANVAVVSMILERDLHYKVNLKRLTAAESWPAIASGNVDVILENWNHAAQKKRYIEDERVAVSAGVTGNKAIVGWYIPIWMTQRYPGILDWHNLNKYSSLFATNGSHGRGVLLESDRSYATNDAALIGNLKLNYELAYSGSEQATIEAAQDATRNQKPLLFYFWEPHYLFQQSRYARVSLPEYAPGCDADPARIACDYPVEDLDKIVSRRFAATGGKAYRFIREFHWTNADQDEVARYIAVDKLGYREAANNWMQAHPDAWSSWVRL